MALEVPEHEHVLFVRRETVEGGHHISHVIRLRDISERLLGGVMPVERDRPGTFACRAERLVAGDDQEPGAEGVGIGELAEVLVSRDEGVLGGVFGGLAVVQNLQGHREDGVLVAFDEGGERLAVAGQDAVDELSVAFQSDGSSDRSEHIE